MTILQENKYNLLIRNVFNLKKQFFESWPWFKFNKLEMYQGVIIEFFSNTTNKFIKVKPFFK